MISEIVAGFLLLLGLFYLWSKSTFEFWRERGVPGPKPTPISGNLGPFMQKKISFPQLMKKFYDSYENAKFIGLFFRKKPYLMLKDLDLIQTVLVSDFSKFSDKGDPIFENAEPLSQHLLNLEYTRWSPLRKKLSPVYTTKKLKEMFNLLLNCGDNLQIFMEKLIEKNDSIEARELTARFATDVIGTCAFGLDVNAMAEEDNEFRKMGQRAVNPNTKKIFLHQFKNLFPSLYEFFGSIVRDNLVTDFFINTMKDTMSYRRENKIIRHDFLQNLMDIQDNPEQLSEINLTDSFLASQLFIFFIASFETTSSAMSHVLYELAQHHDYQDKLREEIKDTLKENEGKLTYDSVKNMKFMDMVVKEILRLYPTIPRLLRCSNTDYKFPGTNLKIPKNTPIVIPVYAIHRDPNIYPNPEKFNPDNFTDDAVKSRHPMGFCALGAGPRICIGAKFGYQQIKVGIIKMLERYQVDVCEKTDVPYKMSTHGFTVAPMNGIHVKFTKIQSED